MTNVEISYKYGMSPSDALMRGIDNIREVYGIRRLRIDEEARRMVDAASSIPGVTAAEVELHVLRGEPHEGIGIARHDRLGERFAEVFRARQLTTGIARSVGAFCERKRLE